MTDRRTVEAEACAWIAQLDGAEPSQEDLAALREWMSRSPQHRAEIERLSTLWDDLNILTRLAVPLPGREKPPRRRFVPAVFGGAITVAFAGLTALAVAVGVWQWRDKEDGPAMVAGDVVTHVGPVSQAAVYSTSVGRQQVIDLADGSRVTLNTDSRIEVRFDGTDRRIDLLRGEALFEVAHDPDRAFKVYAGNGLVRAVGTAFSVYLKSADNVSVTVTEGEVELASVAAPVTVKQAVAEPAAAGIARIKAGQSATFGRNIESIQSLAQAELERQLSWREGMLRFDGEPLGQVVQEVSRYTTQKIVILDPAVRDLRIGGYFKVGEIEAMFEALESSFGVRVERINEKLVHLSAAGE